jgi:hypothetical protein
MARWRLSDEKVMDILLEEYPSDFMYCMRTVVMNLRMIVM